MSAPVRRYSIEELTVGLQWKCERCGQGSWLHHETCASCGMNRPAPPPAETKPPSHFSRPEIEVDPA